jgi:hypothetical protein
MTPVVDAPLVSLSSTVAIAFEANPAANSGTAAKASAVRSFRFIEFPPKDIKSVQRAIKAY